MGKWLRKGCKSKELPLDLEETLREANSFAFTPLYNLKFILVGTHAPSLSSAKSLPLNTC